MRIHVLPSDGWVNTNKTGAVVAIQGEPRVLFASSASSIPAEEFGIPINLNEVYEIKAGSGETLFVKASGNSPIIVDVI